MFVIDVCWPRNDEFNDYNKLYREPWENIVYVILVFCDTVLMKLRVFINVLFSYLIKQDYSISLDKVVSCPMCTLN